MKPHLLTVGHACLDMVYRVPYLADADKKVASTDMAMQIGGSAGNTASAIVDLGASADVCTVLGNPTRLTTHNLIHLLRDKGIGVECTFVDRVSGPVSTICITPDGNNSITSWQPEPVREAVHFPQDITKYSAVLGDVYRLPMVKVVFEQAAAARIPTFLDIDLPVDNVKDLPQADHVWLSHAAWTNLDERQKDLRTLQQHFGKVVGVTNGPNPVIWIDESGSIQQLTPPEVTAINTLGAGDVFRAALAVALCLGESLSAAIKIACIRATQHITNTQLMRI